MFEFYPLPLFLASFLYSFCAVSTGELQMFLPGHASPFHAIFTSYFMAHTPLICRYWHRECSIDTKNRYIKMDVNYNQMVVIYIHFDVIKLCRYIKITTRSGGEMQNSLLVEW
jgi:hypothetical protein